MKQEKPGLGLKQSDINIKMYHYGNMENKMKIKRHIV